jgi:glutathione peroxidase
MVFKRIMNHTSIYHLSATNMAGKEVSLEAYRGQVLLIANTATKCGEAPQLEKLEALHQQYKHAGFSVLGFPCGQFAGQEPLEGAAIEEYCKINYGVSFPIFQKVDVRGSDAHPIFNYFADRKQNGKFAIRPWWNYYKFLIGRDGRVIDYWITYTQPDAKRIAAAIEKALQEKPVPAL